MTRYGTLRRITSEATMSTERQNIVGSLGGVTFHNPGAFWFSVVASSVGVLLHLPMYIGGRDMGYRLAGMPVDRGEQCV